MTKTINKVAKTTTSPDVILTTNVNDTTTPKTVVTESNEFAITAEYLATIAPKTTVPVTTTATTKAAIAVAIMTEVTKDLSTMVRGAVINRLVNEAGMTKNYAATFYQLYLTKHKIRVCDRK